jgi:hypothetical protein
MPWTSSSCSSLAATLTTLPNASSTVREARGMALYQNYRPHDFEEVVGQESVVPTLRNALANDQVRQTYLFAGRRGAPAYGRRVKRAPSEAPPPHLVSIICTTDLSGSCRRCARSARRSSSSGRDCRARDEAAAHRRRGGIDVPDAARRLPRRGVDPRPALGSDSGPPKKGGGPSHDQFERAARPRFLSVAGPCAHPPKGLSRVLSRQPAAPRPHAAPLPRRRPSGPWSCRSWTSIRAACRDRPTQGLVHGGSV